MADICCDVGSGGKASSTACELPSRAARKKRIEIRRFKFVAGVAPATESGRKRPRIGCVDPTAVAIGVALVPLDLDAGVVEDPLERGDAVGVGGKMPSSEASTAPAPSPACVTVVPHQPPRYGVTSFCGRRRDMEDAVSVRPAFASRAEASFHFLGVFDGHGCSHVAVSCKDRMHEVVREELERCDRCPGPLLAEPEWTTVMERSFARMDAEVVGCSDGAQLNARCRCEMQTPKCEHVGSTAVVAVVTPDRVVVGNCGDSRAVLCRKGVPVPLSSDHKPDRPDELQRIQAAGGRVIYWDGARVLGVLAMSRAIGDHYLKPYVISEPEVTVTARSDDDECLILASDGLWDVVSNETACDVVRTCLRGSSPPCSSSLPESASSPPPPQAEARGGSHSVGSDKACADAALLLTKLALARRSSDNVSVVVVDLRRRS